MIKRMEAAKHEHMRTMVLVYAHLHDWVILDVRANVGMKIFQHHGAYGMNMEI